MTSQQDLEKHAQGLAARAKAIITDPSGTWPKIAAEADEPMQIFMRYVLPLAAIGPIASFIGGQLFGYGGFGITIRIGFLAGLTSLIVGYVGALISVWLIAWIANFLSPKFGGKDDFPAAFRLVAYSMTAAWIVGIVGLVPMLGVLGLAALYSLYLFYKGAPDMMSVPAEKGVVYTALTVICGIVANFVIGLITASITGPGLMGGAALTGNVDGDDVQIDLGEYGSIQVDGDQQTIDLGAMGQAQVNTETGEVTVNVDGQEMKVQVDPEDLKNEE